jgi:hypothetical protein
MEGLDHLFDVFPGGFGPDSDALPVGLEDPRVAAAFDEVVAFLDRYTADR